jgi:hypothetical protein
VAGGSVDLNRIHLGQSAGQNGQSTNAIAIGAGAGQTNQGTNAIAIGAGAGATNQHANSIILNASGSPLNSGSVNAFYVSPVRGPQTFSNTLYFNTSTNEITYGPNATSIPTASQWSEYLFWNTNTSSWGVAGGSADLNRIHLGQSAGQNGQSTNAIAIGAGAGQTNQGTNAIAIGAGAGATNQHANSIILNASGSAFNSGTANAFYVSPVRGPQTFSNTLYFNTSTNEITYGPNATSIPTASQWSEYLFWNTNTSSWGVAGGSADNDRIHLGRNAGQNGQSTNAIAIGAGAGQANQGTNAIAIGVLAGQFDQSTQCVAMGRNAGNFNQGLRAVAIGDRAGETSQKSEAIALGVNAGLLQQGTNAIAIGTGAGEDNQDQKSVAIGFLAGLQTQRDSAIAIGNNAGNSNQGTNSIAIGTSAGNLNQAANSIIINATGSAVSPSASGFFVSPVRAGLTGTGLIYTTGGEIGQTSSSLRYKENISDLYKDTSKILEIKAKSFNLKSGAKNRMGYIAEEVFEVDPSLVILNNENQPEALEEFHMFVCLVEEVKKLKNKSYTEIISTNSYNEPTLIVFTDSLIEQKDIIFEESKIKFTRNGVYELESYIYGEIISSGREEIQSIFLKNGINIPYSGSVICLDYEHNPFGKLNHKIFIDIKNCETDYIEIYVKPGQKTHIQPRENIPSVKVNIKQLV